MPLPKLPLVAEMPKRMVPAGDSNAFDASMRMTRASTEVAAHSPLQSAHLPDEALCRDDVCCAPQAKKICTKEVKIAPK